MPTIKKHEIAKWSVNEMIVTGVTYTDGKVTGLTVRESANSGESKEFVSVPRCKDCVHFCQYEVVEDFDGRCTARGGETDKEEFCSYGSKHGGGK